MKSLVVLLLFAAVLLIPQSVFSGQLATIDEVAATQDSEMCKDCHEDVHEAWSQSWHAKSITDPRTIRTFRTYILSGVDKLPDVKRTILRDMCLMCHAPAALGASDELAEQIAGLVVTAVDDKDASKRDAATKELAKLNINCMTCHGVKNPGGLPPGTPQPNTIFGPGNAEDPPHKDEFGFDTVKADNMKKAEFCKPCHHGCPEGMTSKECPTQWSVYQEHYLAHGGDKTCQQCHMQGEGGESHRFPGIYEKDFAKTAIELKLSATPTRYFYHLENRSVPAVVMNVQLKNVGAHDLPHG
jgi:mono/diheme cytochrome c family protein